MEHASVVPDEHVTDLPFLGPDVLWQSGVAPELVEQLFTFFYLGPDDVGPFSAAEVEGLAGSLGMAEDG
jgi:hypothetical protein